MFIGHFGVGFGLKRLAPRVSLALLIAATVWADILWTVFLLLGWVYRAYRADWIDAAAVWIGVVSHWVLD